MGVKWDFRSMNKRLSPNEWECYRLPGWWFPFLVWPITLEQALVVGMWTVCVEHVDQNASAVCFLICLHSCRSLFIEMSQMCLDLKHLQRASLFVLCGESFDWKRIRGQMMANGLRDWHINKTVTCVTLVLWVIPMWNIKVHLWMKTKMF